LLSFPRNLQKAVKQTNRLARDERRGDGLPARLAVAGSSSPRRPRRGPCATPFCGYSRARRKVVLGLRGQNVRLGLLLLLVVLKGLVDTP
jgi:hypothetical protein